MVAQVADQPEFQRVHRGHVAAVGQRHVLRCVLVVQLLDAFPVDLVARQRVVDEGAELLQGRVRGDGAVRGRELRGQWTHAGKQQRLRFVRGLALVLVPELGQEDFTFVVGEARQVACAARVVGIGQQRRRGTRQLEHVVAHHVAHQAHEHQVRRLLQRVLHRHDLAVIELAEVAEVVQAAAGEEAFARVARIGAVHRGVEHRRQAAVGVRRQRQEVIHGPLAQAVFRIDAGFAQRLRVHRFVAAVQLVDDVEVGHERAQLGGRTQVELGLLVDVERLVVVIGLHAQVVHVVPALHQREAVHHLGRVAVAEHALAGKAGRLRGFGAGELAQRGRDGLLGFGVQRGHHRQIQSVEVVQARLAQQIAEVVAHRVRGLARNKSIRRRRLDAGAEGRMQLDVQRGVAQLRRDHAGLRQHAQVAVGQRFEVGFAGAQVIGRAALRDHQRQRFLVGQHGVGVVHAALQRGGYLVEIAAVPDPHAVADAVHFAVADLRRQRHRVQVVEHDLAPRAGRVLAVLVGAQRGRGHLDQLVFERGGAPFRRVAVLFDLGGKRGTAGHAAAAAQADRVQGLVEHRFREAVPLDGRVAFRVGRVQQFAVFDEQQALHQQLRRVVEARVLALGELRAEQRLVAAIEDLEAGAGLFAVGGKDAVVGQFQHLRRHARLSVDGVVARLQLVQESRQMRVTEAGVVGAVGREADRVARTLLHAEADFLHHAGKNLRLQRGGAGFVDRVGGAGDDDDQHQPEQDAFGVAAAFRRLAFAFRLVRFVGDVVLLGVGHQRQVRITFVQRRILLGRIGSHRRRGAAAIRAPAQDAHSAKHITWPFETACTFHDGSTGLNHCALHSATTCSPSLLRVCSSRQGHC